MLKKTIIILAVAAAFCLGFTFNSIFGESTMGQKPMKRATGIGGIFFKCKDPSKMMQWYKTHLGFNMQQWGVKFDWREDEDSTKKGYTVWSAFNEKSKYFEPSTKDFMINYRVDNILALVETLKKEGVTVVDTVETYEYGKFVHVMDIEGNKLELWEPAR